MEQIVKCNLCGEPEHIARYEGFPCLDEYCLGTYEFLPQFTEQWRDIPGWEGYYQASNMGRIKGLEREVQVGAHVQKLKERVIYGSVSPEGYLFVKLSRNGVVEEFPNVARLCYSVWMGSPEGWTIDHINKVRMDNRITNLRLLTSEDNANRHWRDKGSRGVTWSKRSKAWLARSSLGGSEKFLGSFATKQEAQEAYNNYYMSIKGKMW